LLLSGQCFIVRVVTKNMVALFDNLGYIAPIIGVVFIIAAIMIAKRMMAETPDTHDNKGKDKKDSKDEDDKKPEDEEKEVVEDLNVEAGVVHKLETEEKREHDEEGFEEARVGEVEEEIQDETAAISEEASAEKTHNEAAEKKAMEHEKKAIGKLEKDLQAIARQLKQYVGDENKLIGDFGTAIEKLRKLNQNMVRIELSVAPDNAEANNKDRIGDILSLEQKRKVTEQSSEQIINTIEAEINRVRADIQGVKSSYSQQAHETLKNDLSTLKLSLGTEFQKITEVRSANNTELKEIELMFEESVKGLEEVKEKIAEKAAEEKRKIEEEKKRLEKEAAEERRKLEEEERNIAAELEKAKQEAAAEKLGSALKALEEEKVQIIERFQNRELALSESMAKTAKENMKLIEDMDDNRAEGELASAMDLMLEDNEMMHNRLRELRSERKEMIGEINREIFDKRAELRGSTVKYEGNTRIISKGGSTLKI